MTSATLGKPLIREYLFYRGQTSVDAAGQWLVCCGVASPTENRCDTGDPLRKHR